jgi:hypothetical protein
MSDIQYKTIARRFVEEIFNARKIEAAKDFVTPDIIYHGIVEEVRGFGGFQKVGGRRSLSILRYADHNIRRD